MSDATMNVDKMSRTAALSLSSGVFFVIATLVAVAMLNIPNAAVAESPSTSCPLAEVSLDQGYGVSRMSIQPVCRDIDQTLSGNIVAR